MIDKKEIDTKEKSYMMKGIAIVALFYGVLHIFTLEGLLDDPIFANYHEQYSLFQFLYMRYQEWTSRVFLEAVTSVVLQCFTIWRILDTLMYVSLFLSIRRVMRIKGNGNLFLAMLVCSYIMLQMVSAGWGATSVNYLWTLAAAWTCITLLQKFTEEQKCKPHLMICYCMLMLFACNNEVTAVIMLMVYIILALATWCGRKILTDGKRIVISKAGLYVGILLQIVSVIFFATAKGNRVRLESAYSELYENLTVIGKIRIGLVSTFEHFVSIPNAIFFVFCLTLAFLAWQEFSKLRDKLMGSIPLAIDIVLTMYYVLKDIILGGKRNYVFAEPPMIPEQIEEWIRQWGLICLLFVFIGEACYIMWHVLENRYEFGVSLLILAAGGASRMAMAFTPSVYVSGTRTFAMIYFCFIAVTSNLCIKVRGKWQKKLVYIVLAAGMLINAVLTIVPFLQGHN